MLERIAELMLTAREVLWREFAKLHREVLAIVKEGPGLPPPDDGAGCRRPGVADLPRRRR